LPGLPIASCNVGVSACPAAGNTIASTAAPTRNLTHHLTDQPTWATLKRSRFEFSIVIVEKAFARGNFARWCVPVVARERIKAMIRNDFTGEGEPLVLLMPGLNDSGSAHWQTLWEDEVPDCARVELGRWDNPCRNTWVNQINLAIYKAGRPVILVAHSLGCHAVAWWNEYERPDPDGPVKGALLVAPPDVEQDRADPRLARFAPVMPRELAFPSTLAASRDDPYITFGRARRLARIWKSRFIDAGWLGHINADSGIGSWPFGQFLLRQVRSTMLPSHPSMPAALQRSRSAAHSQAFAPG
jgi:predicted alpha/beta hydrolase family esterase